MSELRGRIASVLSRTYTSGPAKVVLEDIAAAQAIIDEFDLTPNGDTGYVEIWGYYDTRFEEDK